MTSPPPPHRRQRNQIRSKTARPSYPPQPPRWTTISHSQTPVLGFVQVELVSDIPGTFTLAWTFQKPNQSLRHLVRLGVPRPHHIHYQLPGLHFLIQLNHDHSTHHFFDIPIEPGCHNVYYAVFDGSNPAFAHSISPIFAFAYCAQDYAVPTSTPFVSTALPFPLLPGDHLVIANYQAGGAMRPPLTISHADIKIIDPPSLSGIVLFNGLLPPVQTGVIDFFHEAYEVEITGAAPVFSRRCEGYIIRGANNSLNPTGWAFADLPFSTPFGPLPIPWSGSMLVGSLPSEWIQWFHMPGGGGDLAWSPMNPVPPGTPFRELVLPAETVNGSSNNHASGHVYVGFVRYLPSSTTFINLVDISSQWRKLPNPFFNP